MSPPSPHRSAFNPLLTAAEVADILHVSLRTVRRFIASGELGTFHFGRSVRVEESTLQAFIERSARK